MLNLTRASQVAESLELTEEQIRQFERWRVWRRTELRVMEVQYIQLLHLARTQDMLVQSWSKS